MENYLYDGGDLQTGDIPAMLARTISLSPKVWNIIESNRQALEKLLSGADERYYGINTGFGSLYKVPVSSGDLRQLQTNLIRSHACGAGPAAPRHIVRLTLLLKILSLAKGFSGVRPSLVRLLVDIYNADILPVIPQVGSLGASGDLAPLAHLSLALLGEGEVVYKREQMPAMRALQLAGLNPLELEAKEGLALINGTQYSLAWLLFAVDNGGRLLNIADMCCAASLDAFDCHPSPLDEQIHLQRRQPGQIRAASSIRRWLTNSGIQAQSKEHLQDPYSFRCAPQVHGASRDVLDYVKTICNHEINAVTDNPLVITENGKTRVVSGGNFHAQPLALASDFLAVAMAELGSISERRSYLMLSGQRGLPPSLAVKPGLESGMMICQYTAAAVVNRNKILCTPASIDTIVTSAGQEDHVSMAANAGIKLGEVVNNVWRILAIEWMIACQALESRKPKKTAESLLAKIESYRKEVPALTGDRVMATDMDVTEGFLRKVSY